MALEFGGCRDRRRRKRYHGVVDRAQYNQRKQQNNKKQITLWKPKEHCVQFAVVMYEKKKKKKKKKRGERAKGAADTAVEAPNWYFCPPGPHFYT